MEDISELLFAVGDDLKELTDKRNILHAELADEQKKPEDIVALIKEIETIDNAIAEKKAELDKLDQEIKMRGFNG